MDFSNISAVVVPCSARKLQRSSPLLTACKLPKGTSDDLANAWVKRLRTVDAATLHEPQGLYDGGGFRRAKAVAAEHSAPLFVMSAGLGLVSSRSKIPCYELTITMGSPNSIAARATDAIDVKSWWAMVQAGPFATAMQSIAEQPGRILVGLSQPYAELVAADLEALPEGARARLRIFGMGLRKVLPESLAAQCIHYDCRLDVVVPGTRLDKWSRAMEHFSRLIAHRPMASLVDDQQCVDDALAIVTPTKAPNRARLSDEDLSTHIRALIDDGIGLTAGLKHLRRQMLIACEAQRFRRLYLEQAA